MKVGPWVVVCSQEGEPGASEMKVPEKRYGQHNFFNLFFLHLQWARLGSFIFCFRSSTLLFTGLFFHPVGFSVA